MSELSKTQSALPFYSLDPAASLHLVLRLADHASSITFLIIASELKIILLVAEVIIIIIIIRFVKRQNVKRLPWR